MASKMFIICIVSVLLWRDGSDGNPVESKKVNTPDVNRVNMPELDMRTCEVIRYHGYPCEIHEAETEDHYVLELHRIPHGINGSRNNTAAKKVVFLQHGLLDSSFTWVMNSPQLSLAYILADQGYDVWMGNSRGNTYSRTHKYLTTKDEKFWEFSFTEMALHDLPACITYVLRQTGEKQVDYIGHSQGTMIAFAGFSSNHTLGKQVRLFIALAPVVTVKHMQGMMKYLSKGYAPRLAKVIIKYLGTKNFAPHSWLTKMVAKYVCRYFSSRLCGNMMFLIAGVDATNLIPDRLPIYLAHLPAGTSFKDILHFSQNHETGNFQMYDYGWNGNMRRYMQPWPPKFDISKMDVPLALFSGSEDWLATPADISISIRRHLSENIIYDQVEYNWNHMDFVLGKDAHSSIYVNVVKLLRGETIDSTNNKAKA